MKFETIKLVEAALMRMRLNTDPQCKWTRVREREQCSFSFDSVTEEDLEYARNDQLVSARAFHLAMTQVKTAMYSAKDE